MTKKHFITAKELRAILAAVPDDQPVFIADDDGDAYSIRSYRLFRFDDSKIELIFSIDPECDLEA